MLLDEACPRLHLHISLVSISPTLGNKPIRISVRMHLIRTFGLLRRLVPPWVRANRVLRHLCALYVALTPAAHECGTRCLANETALRCLECNLPDPFRMQWRSQ